MVLLIIIIINSNFNRNIYLYVSLVVINKVLINYITKVLCLYFLIYY